MKDFKKLIREAHLGNPLNENKYLSNKDSYIKITEPSFRKDKNNPNFLSAYINYDTGPGVGIALGKETMAGQIRRLSSAEALRQMEIIGRKLNDSYDLEDLDINDLENGVVELFAVSDDFIGMDPRSELSMAMLEENQKYDDEDIVIYDGEEHIIMRKDGNMVYIRPLEDSAILGKRDEIKVPARALAYKSDLDKMYDEYKPKDEMNEEFSSTEQKMIKQIQSYKKRDSAMVNLPSKVRDFYFKNKEKIDALNEDMNDPVLMKVRAAKIADEKEMARQAALDKKYGSSFMGKLDAELDLKAELQDLKDERKQLMIDMEQEAEPEGGEIADEYGSRLNDIDARMTEIKSELEDLRMYESVNKNINENTLGDLVKKYGKDLINFVIDIDELTKEEIKDVEYLDDRIQIHLEEPEIRQRYLPEGTCGYGEDGVIGDEPAGPDLNEDEIPMYLTSNDAFKKAVEDSVSYNDFEKRVYGILGPKYFKLAKIENPGAMKDYYDSVRVTRPSMEEAFDLDIDDAHSGDAALDRTVGKMGYNESLKKSLKESLNKRLGK